jgi:hypothetical protein
MAANTGTYPVVFEVDTPERLSRWMWLIKWFLLIPHILIFYVLGLLLGVAYFVAWVAILITGKFPRGLFDFMVGVTRWTARIASYGYHQTDKYPPFSMAEGKAYPVRFGAAYPEKSSRVKAFFRWLLAIPHWVVVGVLAFLNAALLLIHIVIVIITGKPNSGIFKLMAGIDRWNMRVVGYVFLFTDQYPPFSLK